MTLNGHGTAIDRLAEFAANASSGALDEPSSIQIADGVIALLAGIDSKEGKKLSAFLSSVDPSPLGVLTANAAAMRLSEIDNIHRSSGVTSSAIALPTALTMSAFSEIQAQRFSDALMVGQSVAIELSLSLGGAKLMSQGLWPSYITAPIGAAATAGRMLGLPASRMRHALAIALAQTPGAVGRSVGARPARWVLFANAVRSGCLAALAALDGIEGDVSILDKSWLRGIGGSLALPTVATPINRTYELSSKAHCAAKQTLAAIHALQVLMSDGLEVAEIQSIEVRVPTAYSGMIDREPPNASRLASMVSVRWQLALTALRPNLLDDVSRDHFPSDPQLENFAAKVKIVADPVLDQMYPDMWPAHLKVVTNGFCHELLVTDSAGDPDLPLNRIAIQAKAKRMLTIDTTILLVNRALQATFDDDALSELCAYFR